MTWSANMQEKKAPKIVSNSCDDYTKITFKPDLARFKIDALSDDMVALFRKRAYDVAGTTAGLKVDWGSANIFQTESNYNGT